jgi:hypothetical protein
MTTKLKYEAEGFPPDAGKALAERLINSGDTDWSDVEVDLTSNPSGALISSFFNGFLQRVADEDADLLARARRVKWVLKFDFQKLNVQRWMREFKPQAGAAK